MKLIYTVICCLFFCNSMLAQYFMQTKHQKMEQDSLYRNRPTIQELSRKMAVGDFIESYRKAYENKDIAFFRKTYQNCLLYNMPENEKYFENMEEVFKINKTLHVTLDSIKIVRHPQKKQFYAVTVLVTCDTDIHQEKGYSFWLIQFEDDTRFRIHIVSWQPYETTPKEEVVTLGDFDMDY